MKAIVLIAMAGVAFPSFLPAAALKIDFARTLQRWDGFGANYVETRHTQGRCDLPRPGSLGHHVLPAPSMNQTAMHDSRELTQARLR